MNELAPRALWLSSRNPQFLKWDLLSGLLKKYGFYQYDEKLNQIDLVSGIFLYSTLWLLQGTSASSWPVRLKI